MSAPTNWTRPPWPDFPPPLEWVDAPTSWLRDAVRTSGSVAASLLVVYAVRFLIEPTTPWPVATAWFLAALLGALLLYGVAKGLAAKWLPPTIPHMGISPAGVVIDEGVWEQAVPWARATLLGGNLLVAPRRIGWVQTYALSDAQARRAAHLRPSPG